ncbi:MAG: hypothetical protein JWM08_354 [Candidatus Angelobacter sp.]|nr:hypothetical protein [Candidatus Angelobacter sp.]
MISKLETWIVCSWEKSHCHRFQGVESAAPKPFLQCDLYVSDIGNLLLMNCGFGPVPKAVRLRNTDC